MSCVLNKVQRYFISQIGERERERERQRVYLVERFYRNAFTTAAKFRLQRIQNSDC